MMNAKLTRVGFVAAAVAVVLFALGCATTQQTRTAGYQTEAKSGCCPSAAPTADAGDARLAAGTAESGGATKSGTCPKSSASTCKKPCDKPCDKADKSSTSEKSASGCCKAKKAGTVADRSGSE